MWTYIEYALGSLLTSQRGRDDKLFIKGPAFVKLPKSTIEVTSPECGQSNSHLSVEHSADGQGRFPQLQWKAPKDAAEIKEYILIVEDPDAPLPNPIVHGIYHSIPADVNSVDGSSFEQKAHPSEERMLAGGFKYGQNRRGTVYIGPRPVLGHGPHRYFFQVVGLGEKLSQSKLSAAATKEELAREIEGKVVGWGSWIGVYERKLG